MFGGIRLGGLLRTVARGTPAGFFPFMERRNEYDKLELDTEENEFVTGIEAVKRMFRKRAMDEISVELHTVIQSSITGFFLGCCYGGFIKSRLAYLNFIESNQATIFKTTMDAKKKLQDQVLLAFARGGYHYGWRVAYFSGCFSLISTVVSVYRGETSVIEYVVAGMITGGIYKANLGLAASVVGAGLGGVLSLVAGTVIVLLLKITGIKMDDIRRALYSFKEKREEQMRQVRIKASNEMEDDLTKHHDVLVLEVGVKKVEEL